MSAGVVEVPFDGKIYMALDGTQGLRAAAQFGAAELHGWMSRLDALDRPDRMIFDLDPDERLGFDAVKTAATLIRDGLAAIGIKSWPLLCGGKGAHVVAPPDRSLTTSEVEGFAKDFAEGVAGDAPALYVASMSKARREGRLFIDWMRDKRGATAILPWSARARSGRKRRGSAELCRLCARRARRRLWPQGRAEGAGGMGRILRSDANDSLGSAGVRARVSDRRRSDRRIAIFASRRGLRRERCDGGERPVRRTRHRPRRIGGARSVSDGRSHRRAAPRARDAAMSEVQPNRRNRRGADEVDKRRQIKTRRLSLRGAIIGM